MIDETRRYGIPGAKRRVDGISDSRGRGMARVLSKLAGLQHRKIAANPSIGVYVPAAPKSRERVLTNTEIFWFWRATDKINQPFGAMLKLLLLTGARLREVAGMRRAELSEDGAIWSIPGMRTKNKRDHSVPLSLLACEIIDGVRTVSGAPGFVFSTTGLTPISGFSKTKRRLDELMALAAKVSGVEIPPWRLHDLRRTCATGGGRVGTQWPRNCSPYRRSLPKPCKWPASALPAFITRRNTCPKSVSLSRAGRPTSRPW